MKRSILQTFLWTTFLLLILTSIFWTSGFAQANIEIPTDARPDGFFFWILFILVSIVANILLFFYGRFMERKISYRTSLAIHMRQAEETPRFSDIMTKHKFLSILLFILSFFILVMIIDLIF